MNRSTAGPVFASFAGLLLAVPAMAQSATPFVARDFVVPVELETPDFRLRMLSVNDVVKDYDAVMSSAPFLKEIFQGSWPDGLTLEANLVDLGWHQKEFQDRRSFAYTVVSLDESRVLGCVYINPTRKRGYDAAVSFWARESAPGSASDERLSRAVRAWIDRSWPFEQPAYPGRDIPWAEWRAIPDEKR
jgi:hypothetical protein